MSNKVFGIVVGIVVALALAMFGGLYVLGLAGQGHAELSDDYSYTLLDDGEFYFDDTDLPQEDDDFTFEEIDTSDLH